MDFNSGSVPPNQLCNLMALPQTTNRQPDKEKEAVQVFWQEQKYDISNTEAFKSQQQLPLARIKRIMKAGGHVKMISAETPILFAKACELFIQELTLRAWMRTEDGKRRTLRRCDIANAINRDDALNFLSHVAPIHHHNYHLHHVKDEDAGNYGEGTQGIINQPYAVDLMNSPMMNVGTEAVAKTEHFSQPCMTQPPFMPSPQFPYNLQPKQ